MEIELGKKMASRLREMVRQEVKKEIAVAIQGLKKEEMISSDLEATVSSVLYRILRSSLQDEQL